MPVALAERGGFELRQPGAARLLAAELLGSEVGGLTLRWDGMSGSPKWLAAPAGNVLAEASGAGPEASARAFLRQRASLFGLDTREMEALEVTSVVRRPNGAAHVYFRQRAGALEVFGGRANVNLAADGSVVSVGSSLYAGIRGVTVPGIGPEEAIRIAASDVYPGLPLQGVPISIEEGGERKALFDDAGFGRSPEAKLVLLPTADGATLAWQVQVAERSLFTDYRILVDAGSGQVLWRRNATRYVDARILDANAPNPETEEREPSDFTLVSLPDAGSPTTESPLGWIDLPGTLLSGNNAAAYRRYWSAPVYGDPAALYDYTFNTNRSSLTNAWYWTNEAHDLYYRHGFDEDAGNYQTDNDPDGDGTAPGIGGDAISVIQWEGGGRNNAFYTGSTDGGFSTTNYFWVNCRFCGDHDALPENGGEISTGFMRDVILHEYGHGGEHAHGGWARRGRLPLGRAVRRHGGGLERRLPGGFLRRSPDRRSLLHRPGLDARRAQRSHLRRPLRDSRRPRLRGARRRHALDRRSLGPAAVDVCPRSGERRRRVQHDRHRGTPEHRLLPHDARRPRRDPERRLEPLRWRPPRDHLERLRRAGDGRVRLEHRRRRLGSGGGLHRSGGPSLLAASASHAFLHHAGGRPDPYRLRRHRLERGGDLAGRSRRPMGGAAVHRDDHEPVLVPRRHRPGKQDLQLPPRGHGGRGCGVPQRDVGVLGAHHGLRALHLLPGLRSGPVDRRLASGAGRLPARSQLDAGHRGLPRLGRPDRLQRLSGPRPRIRALRRLPDRTDDGHEPSPPTARGRLPRRLPGPCPARHRRRCARPPAARNRPDLRLGDDGRNPAGPYEQPLLGLRCRRAPRLDHGQLGRSPGGWTLVDPVGTTYGGTNLPPETGDGGSGMAWVTGDPGGPSDHVSEFDNDGRVRLTTPTFDGLVDGMIFSFDYWMHTTGEFDGGMYLEISNGTDTNFAWNLGMMTVQAFETNGSQGWQHAELDLSRFVPPTSTMTVTFVTLNNGILGEAGVDNVAVDSAGTCSESSLFIDSVAVDDGDPGWGNGNGFLEPGETARLILTLGNDGSDTAFSPRAELVGVPAGVQAHVTADVDFPDIPPSSTGTSLGPVHITVTASPGAECEETADFEFNLTDSAGSAASARWAQEHGSVSTEVVFFDDLETSIPGWDVSGAGDGAGGWEWGDPVGTVDGATPANPEDCADSPGTLCWVTDNGLVAASPFDNDVDTGDSARLFSPHFDTTPYKRTRMSLDLWYYDSSDASDRFEDLGDWGMYQDDGFLGWGRVLARWEPSGGWIPVGFDLTGSVPRGPDARGIFRAFDRGSDHIVEMGIDNVLVEGDRAVCDPLGVVNPPNGIGDSLMIAKSTTADLSWADPPVDGTHDGTAFFELYVSAAPDAGFSATDTTTELGMARTLDPVTEFYKIVAENPAGTSGDEPAP